MNKFNCIVAQSGGPTAAIITGSMVCVCRESDKPYKIHYDHAPISQIANEARSVPVEWIAILSAGYTLEARVF